MHLELALESGPTLGHALGTAEVLEEPEVEAANVLFCFACGAFGIPKTSALGELCTSGLRAASSAARLRRVLRGLHPTKALRVSAAWRMLTPCLAGGQVGGAFSAGACSVALRCAGCGGVQALGALVSLP